MDYSYQLGSDKKIYVGILDTDRHGMGISAFLLEKVNKKNINGDKKHKTKIRNRAEKVMKDMNKRQPMNYTKEHLARNGRGRDEDPQSHLGYHPDVPQQTGVEDL